MTDGIVDYAVLVSSKNPVKRISAALGALDVADGPMSRLEAARRLRAAAEELEQGAQQRFRAARNQAKAAAAAPGSKKDEPPA